MAGPLGLSSNHSEKEFISFLRSGIALCNTVNKIKPGAVPKVVMNQSFGLAMEIQPLPAYQYFENIRNFLVAVEELKLPSFEASDLKRDTLEAGSAAKIVDCILALKSYHEWKQSSGGCGSSKHVKSSLVPLTAGRIQLNGMNLGSSVRRLDLPANLGKPQSMPNDDQNSGDKVNGLVQTLSNCMFDSKENIDQSLLDSLRQGSADSTKFFSKIISSYMQEQELRSILKDLSLEGKTQMNNSSTIQVQKDLETEKLIGTGHEFGYLYYLDENPPAVACSSSNALYDVHCRLGHPCLQTLKKMVHFLGQSSSLEYKAANWWGA